MKKPILILLCCTAVILSAAQQPKTIPIQRKDSLPAKKLISNRIVKQVEGVPVVPQVVFYEKPDYKGDSSSLVRKPDGSYALPFPLTDVSFRIPRGKIIYIKSCVDEFPDEKAHIHSRRSINLTGICGLRIDDLDTITVIFNGISTEVHNLDCMRFAGTIKVNANELSPLSDGMVAALPLAIRAGTTIVSSYSQKIFDWGPSQLSSRNYDPKYNNTGTIFNNNPVPVLTDTAQNFFKRSESRSVMKIAVGKSALREQRISITVITDLTSSHKTCDLCDDFSSGIKMDRVQVETFPINKPLAGGQIIDAAHPQLVAGPYTARGSRDGFAVTAHGGTVKNFRVHLSVLGL